MRTEGADMSVGSVLIGLQASRAGGRGIATDEFLTPLNIQPGEVEAARADGGEWASGMVYLSVVRLSAFADIDDSIDAGAPTEAFFAGLVEAFRAAGRFLDRRPPEVLAALRAVGLSLRLFVDVRMDDDQMDLELPPEFLAACGRHALTVYIISNDIPAAEILAVRNDESGAETNRGGK
jgi:hypothetical protein